LTATATAAAAVTAQLSLRLIVTDRNETWKIYYIYKQDKEKKIKEEEEL
jgi:hypothetical protein